MPSRDTTASRDAARPRRRADAQRNYDLVLAAAKEVFEEQGVSAPLDEIARRAGVGNATMYRHFPARRDLVIAVYADEVTELCTLGESLLDEESPGDALFTWLRAFTLHIATKRELPLALTDDPQGQRSELFDSWHQAMRSTAFALLASAQQSTDIRADLDVSDLLALVHGAALTGADAGQRERLLMLIRNGVEPR
ncbi:TetR/AcrR family transcriptional regulator [Streptomyces sp. NBC_01465]|uniref:TetR/AcrR family transcriptional regulator n=1 Tax=Streptomyces sp. NBC_01465 TaxID=2903878 RepID=UPI002E3607A7|nr:helix-turn-helix domain-containing protein [Streptomyces sp. NBC_01465]